jgi:hypothetical protein
VLKDVTIGMSTFSLDKNRWCGFAQMLHKPHGCSRI